VTTAQRQELLRGLNRLLPRTVVECAAGTPRGPDFKEFRSWGQGARQDL
jgi:hypothetical protein